MTQIVFLYASAITLIFSGVEMIFWKKEIKISDRLATFLFLGSVTAAIKAATTKPVFYKISKYKNLIGISFVLIGLIIYFVALSNSKYLSNY